MEPGHGIPSGTHEGRECEIGLDKNFGFLDQFAARYEMGKEIGRGGFGRTCSAKAKEGSLKGQEVAVKVIRKSKMTTATDVECVRREVQILRALTERIGHKNLIQFYDAYEDGDNVYIVMELCQGGGRLKDFVGSEFTVAPDVLHASYGTEADMWSIGVIAYMLLCGDPPFWGQNQSEIFRAIREEEPSFDEDPWPSRSPEAIDFVKRLLNKNYRRRPTAAQALCLPWLVSHHDVKIPLDMMMCRLVIAYMRSSPPQKAALQALVMTLTKAQLAYLRKQFEILGGRKGFIFMQDFKEAVTRRSTEAMKHSGTLEYANEVSNLAYGAKFDFQEFCAAAISADQLAGTASLEEYARDAFKHFPREERRVGTSQRQTTFNEFIKLLHDHSQTI